MPCTFTHDRVRMPTPVALVGLLCTLLGSGCAGDVGSPSGPARSPAGILPDEHSRSMSEHRMPSSPTDASAAESAVRTAMEAFVGTIPVRYRAAASRHVMRALERGDHVEIATDGPSRIALLRLVAAHRGAQVAAYERSVARGGPGWITVARSSAVRPGLPTPYLLRTSQEGEHFVVVLGHETADAADYAAVLAAARGLITDPGRWRVVASEAETVTLTPVQRGTTVAPEVAAQWRLLGRAPVQRLAPLGEVRWLHVVLP